MTKLTEALKKRLEKHIESNADGYVFIKEASDRNEVYEKEFLYSDYITSDEALEAAFAYANEVVEYLKVMKWIREDDEKQEYAVFKKIAGVSYDKSFGYKEYGSKKKALSAAKKYRDSVAKELKFITETNTGLMVRKTINGKMEQEFFGITSKGSGSAALAAAKKYRDGMIEETKSYRAYQRNSKNNTTGFVGVVWHCAENKARPGTVIHAFRAQAPDLNYAPGEKMEDGREPSPIYRAYSIIKHGMWLSYLDCVEWRHRATLDELPSMETVLKKFGQFMNHYITVLRDKRISKNENENRMEREHDALCYKEMVLALEKLCQDESTPYEVIQMIPRAVRERHDKTQNRGRLLVGNVQAGNANQTSHLKAVI